MGAESRAAADAISDIKVLGTLGQHIENRVEHMTHGVDTLQPRFGADFVAGGKRLGIIVALILVSPFWYLLHKRIKPPLFEMEISPEGVEYKFRDAEYANDFEELNQTDGVSNETDNEPRGPKNSADG